VQNGRGDLALDAALAEAAGHQDGVEPARCVTVSALMVSESMYSM
jgi:hypothetical protein